MSVSNSRDQKFCNKEICLKIGCKRYKNCSVYKDNTKMNLGGWKIKLKHEIKSVNKKKINNNSKIKWLFT